jgi:hypothetical protein
MEQIGIEVFSPPTDLKFGGGIDAQGSSEAAPLLRSLVAKSIRGFLRQSTRNTSDDFVGTASSEASRNYWLQQLMTRNEIHGFDCSHFQMLMGET